MNKRVYLATPVGDPGTPERSVAQYVKDVLESNGFTVYAPWEMHIPHAWDYTNAEWGLMVFSRDMHELEACDFAVVISYGRNCTAGTAWEQGFLYGIGKKILVVEADGVDLMSIMVSNGCWARIPMEYLPRYDFENLPRFRTTTEQK